MEEVAKLGIFKNSGIFFPINLLTHKRHLCLCSRYLASLDRA